MGLNKEINGVKNTDVDLAEKWVATISTQKGCPMKCKFCDCPKFGFYGNATEEDLCFEIETILNGETVKHTDRFNVHFARMGEPTFNFDVLAFAKNTLKNLVSSHIKAKTIHPVVSTMLPKNNKRLEEFLQEWCCIKNEIYNGEAGLQFSINTTDDKQRSEQFNGMSLSLDEISKIAKKLPMPKGRKYTLNFAVTSQTILSAKELSRLFDKEKFIVKITPIHETNSAIKNGFDVTTSYTDYDVYRQFEKPLLDEGWQVIVFVPSKEEDSDRITCGNALIADQHGNFELKDNETMKALECCIKFVNAEEVPCNECPFHDYDDCLSVSRQQAIDLINRQKAEIERLHTLCKPTETSGYKIENGKVVFYTKILNGYRHEYESLDRVVNDMNIMLQNAYKTDEIAGHYKGKVKTAKSEAIKEFAERFWIECAKTMDTGTLYWIKEIKNNLVKEMTEKE